MSQVITNAFEQYWQSCLTTEQPVVLDEFILADIPNLDITSPIDPETGLPPQSQIVHRQNVDQRGRINNNAVAYTIVMDTTVGDFSFNAMYLRNKQNGVIGMIVYKGRETKLKTDQTTGQTGNSLVKSMLMGYDQAAEATITNVDAGTWQIDYAARLRGMDEDIRQLQADLYGHHTFIGDGFKVVEKDGAYQVTKGVAIVGGLRVELKAPEVIHPGTKPIGVWVDAYRAGSLLSEHQNHFTIITSVADLTDHADSNGYPHYVAKLATVQADSTVIDGRGQGGSSGIDSSKISDPVDNTVADALIKSRANYKEALRRTYYEAGYFLVGPFKKGSKVNSDKDVLLDEETGKGYAYSGAYPHTVVDGETTNSEGWSDKSGEALIAILSGNWAVNDELSLNITDIPLLQDSSDNRIKWLRNRAALRAGVSDSVPLDDPMSHFRGLVNKNTWDDAAYHGVGSTSLGRNGAAFAYLSTTLGHDCVTYGAASLAGGAGTATGNPDEPTDDANFGYCSLAWGKYSQALGRISYSFGEECIAGSRNSWASGWKAKTGPCVVGMPNPIGPGAIPSEGRAAIAKGAFVEAYGDYSVAIGHFLKAYNSAQAFGYGINTGSPGVSSVPGAVSSFCNSDVPYHSATPGPGTNGGFSRNGWNTGYPNERYESVMKSGDKAVYRLDEGGEEGFFELQSTVGGIIAPVVQIRWDKFGVASLLINGEPVLKNRAAAIPDAGTTEEKVQSILDTLRYHGLIGS